MMNFYGPRLKIVLLLLILTAAGLSDLRAQSAEWIAERLVSELPNVPGGAPQFLVPDGAGGVCHAFLETINQDRAPQYFGDWQIERYNAEGERIQEFSVTGNLDLVGFAVNERGDYFFVGNFREFVVFGGTDTLFPPFGENEKPIGFWARVAPRGDIEWVSTSTGEFGGQVLAAKPLANGGFWTAYTSDYTNTQVYRVSADGEFTRDIYQRNVGLVGDLTETSDGRLLVTGSCMSRGATFAQYELDTVFDYQTYVACYDAGGTCLWVTQVADEICTKPAIVPHEDGSATYSAELLDAATFGRYSVEGADWGNDFFAARIGLDGLFRWAKEKPNVEGSLGGVEVGSGRHLAPRAENGVLLCGQQRLEVQWNEGLRTDCGTDALGCDMALLVGYAADGTAEWAMTSELLEEENFAFAAAEALLPAGNGKFFLAGAATGRHAFGGKEIGAPGASGYWVALIDENGNPSSRRESPERRFALYPNPARGEAFLQYGAGPAPQEIALRDLSGRLVADFTPENVRPGALRLPLENLAPGMYLLTADDVRLRLVVH